MGSRERQPDANKSTEREDEQRREARVVSDCNMAPRLPLAMATREKSNDP